MARTGKRAPTRRRATLKTIEEHLKEQGKEIKRGEWLAFVIFGSSIALSGLFLMASKFGDMWAYAIVLLYGLAMAFYGLVRKSK
ncbi:unnamed protein product, partial [marine sediment metagenome]